MAKRKRTITDLQNTTQKNQAQASDQFLATNKLATNKAICLKTKQKEIRAKCTFKDF
jgi:hypothetical protein